jgi:hypothetical protein
MTESSYPLNNEFTSRTDRTAELGDKLADTHQQPLTDRLAQGAHHTIDRLAGIATPAVKQLGERVSAVEEALRIKAAQLRETGDEWAESARTTVRANPLTALAAAVTLGALLVSILRRPAHH